MSELHYLLKRIGLKNTLDVLADMCEEQVSGKPRGRKAKKAAKRWRKLARIIDKASRKVAAVE